MDASESPGSKQQLPEELCDKMIALYKQLLFGIPKYKRHTYVQSVTTFLDENIGNKL